ncbi:MAG TPA: sucrase ferredoxin [Bryobacteraceae bacterium]|nr:sucrase ferredoxin [Bryobacteraceae bacterium]
MENGPFFCSAVSRDAKEPLFGTVAHIQRWLLIEYPALWHNRAIEESRCLSGDVKAHLRTLQEHREVDRSLLIRRAHRRSGALRCFFVDSSCRHSSIRRTVFSDYDELLSARERAEDISGLIYAVCTHGRHDKCCAKFGIPVYRALKAIAGQSVWECSHVGGDRFAGNVVVFPYGLYYGHVQPNEVDEIVSRSERGEVWLKRYRGRSCFPRAVQIAEHFVRSETGRMGIDDFWPIQSRRMAGNITSVELESRNDGMRHLLEFETKPEAFKQLLTCGATEEAAVPKYELRSYKTADARP